MKVVKFRDYLVPQVLSGEKFSTWRLFDDKDLSVDDEIELRVFGSLEKFAEARIVKVKQVRFKDLTAQDKAGHETFKNDQAMYQTYSHYYQKPVNANTEVKIIWFELKTQY